jgi:hypothetical protein
VPLLELAHEEPSRIDKSHQLLAWRVLVAYLAQRRVDRFQYIFL